MATCPILLQNTTGSLTIFLTLSTTGAPATGLTFADVSVDLKKEGEGSFTAKSLDALNFVEIGGGVYQINFTTADTDTLGTMYVRTTGATINTSLNSAFIAASAPVNPTTPLTIETTNLFGYITDPQGNPVVGASVSARVLATPTIGIAGSEGYVQSTSLVTAKTDNSGFFTITLVTGSQVDIFIGAANYRRTLQVPSSNTNLFDIP